MKISTFIVSLLVVGLVVTLLGVFFADLAANNEISYNSTQFAGYQQLDEINNQISDINRTLTGLQQSNSATDVVGGFLSSGFSAIKITFNSFRSFYTMVETGFDHLGTAVGVSAGILKVYLVSIVLLLFFFAAIAVLVGREL